MTEFTLDKRLDEDTVLIGDFGLCQLRLMNDVRWPWLVLVPRLAGASEIHDLNETDQSLLAHETALVSSALKRLTGCGKINSAAIGNIVRQLHVHVIARSAGDANWPGPVWGFETRRQYQQGEMTVMIDTIRRELSANFL